MDDKILHEQHQHTIKLKEDIELIVQAIRELYFEIQEVKNISEKLIEYCKETDEERIVLGIPDVMKLMGIGRVYAEKIMWGNYFPTIQIGNRRLVHREVLEQWIKEGGKV